MTRNSLFLHRLLIVTDDNRLAYDETFHRGVNIIRGQNSSGKSTIIRFIFFALGGSYGDFVPEALRCRQVVAEVEIGGEVITLKRELEKDEDGTVRKNAPMYIYYGSIADYQHDSHAVLWHKYGYNTTADRRSFSNILFQMMGLPEFRADSNITMHQILRLIYLDQESPLSSLFLFDHFDREVTRETVAELLMGLYDEHLSHAKLRQAVVQKQMEALRQAIKTSGEMLSNPVQQSPALIESEIERLTREIQDLTAEVQETRESDAVEAVDKMEYQRLQNQVSTLRQQLATAENDVVQLKVDIQDSNYFIAALQKKTEALERSIATRGYFGAIHLEYCPECLSHIEDTVAEGHCRLCKSPIDKSRGKSQALRIKLELEFQIRESQSLLKSHTAQLKEKRALVKRLQNSLTMAQQQYDQAMRHVRSSQEERIDQLLQNKGFKEGLILQYRTMLEQAERYEDMVAELQSLKSENEQLTRSIRAAEDTIRSRRHTIDRTIRDNGIYLLHHDQERQSEFHEASDLRLDYAQNLVYLTDRHIKLSASSSFYLKMAARFAFFLSSVQERSMCYPRLLFSDNMEDKGLEEERSRNFQRIVVQRLQEMGNPDYQLIFATTNIAPELDTPEYTIGAYYTQQNKSLKNV